MDETSGVPVARESEVDRRSNGDRRAIEVLPIESTSPGSGRRTANPPKRDSRWMRWLGIAGRDVGIIIATVTAIVFCVNHAHPIFANQPTLAEQLSKTIPLSKVGVTASPKDTGNLAALLASPHFEQDRQAFAADLVKTGRMTQARADSIAYYAVRESYVEGIPPAVVFGVMLTENALFVSNAMSNVGAVGLMQIYPKIWLKALKDKFGSDLASDSTNLKYGIYILKQYIKSDSGAVTSKNLASGLLHYNGCVHGSNTPNCGTYPSKVKAYVEKSGGSICGDKGFYDCIAKPFIAGLFGKADDSTTALAP
jgi:hypothetical protein